MRHTDYIEKMCRLNLDTLTESELQETCEEWWNYSVKHFHASWKMNWSQQPPETQKEFIEACRKDKKLRKIEVIF